MKRALVDVRHIQKTLNVGYMTRACSRQFSRTCHVWKMEITEAQYPRIEDCLPRQRGNVSLSNLQVLNAILYVGEHGCKWRAARAVWALAHDLHANEPLVQGGRAGAGFRAAAVCSNHPAQNRSRLTGR
jgi:hypothetical protein